MKIFIRHITYKRIIKTFFFGFFLILVLDIYPDDDIEIKGSTSELENKYISADNNKSCVDRNIKFNSDGDNYFSFSSLNINDFVSVRSNFYCFVLTKLTSFFSSHNIVFHLKKVTANTIKYCFVPTNTDLSLYHILL